MARKNNSRKSTPVSAPNKEKKKVTQEKPSAIIPRERTTKAIDELIKFTSNSQDDKEEEQNGKKKLLEDDEEDLKKDLQLIVVNNKSFTGTSKTFKLKLLNVKHSLYKPWKQASATAIKDFKTLLILKDSDIKKVSEDDLLTN